MILSHFSPLDPTLSDDRFPFKKILVRTPLGKQLDPSGGKHCHAGNFLDPCIGDGLLLSAMIFFFIFVICLV